MEEPQTIKLTGTISEQDYLQAQWTHLKPRRAARAFFYILGLLFLVLVIMDVIEWLAGTTPITELWIPAAIIIFMFVFAASCVWQIKRSFRTFKALKVPFNLEVSEDLFFASAEYGESRLPWDIFLKFKEGKNLFLIYQADKLFHMLPKRLFASEAEIRKVREILLRNVKQAPR